MKPDLSTITNQNVRTFYMLYWPQHQILVEFFNQLAEEDYDFCMTGTAEQKSETPRESLAHIIFVQWIYLTSVKTGKLDFNSMSVEPFKQLTKAELLAEWEHCDMEIYSCLTADTFDSNYPVGVPWGGTMNTIDLLFFLRDHDILHIGWNLAYMDLLNVPRYPSLMQYWG